MILDIFFAFSPALLLLAIPAFLLFNKSKADAKMFNGWPEFSDAHKEVQRRIDFILGEGFEGKYVWQINVGGNTGWKNVNSAELEAYAMEFTKPENAEAGFSVETKDRQDGVDRAKGKWGGNYAEIPILNGTRIVFCYNGYIHTVREGGFKYVDWMHYDTAPEAMQDIFELACRTEKHTDAVGWSKLTPGDLANAYAYPSPEIVAKYGNNLSYFVRCAPKNLGCQLVGKNISLSQAGLMIAGVAATVATGGALAPALIAAGASLAPASVSGLVNKVTGVADGSITPEDVRQQATDYVLKNAKDYIIHDGVTKG